MVGIGASAGGLEAFKTFFANMRTDTGMAFVLVQHLDPSTESQLAAIIADYTAMTVLTAVDGALLRGNMVYVIPSNAILTVKGSRLHVTRPATTPARRLSVSTFLTSLAIDQGRNAVGIILSGFGSDGVEGIAAIKEHGGLTLSQAEFDHHAKIGMPQSSASTGFVDHVLPVEDMPAALLNYQHHRAIFDASTDKRGVRRDLPSHLPAICALLNTATGHDFSFFKTTPLMHRIQRRMHVLRIEDVPGYIDKLRTLPSEADTLVREFLVSACRFFRNPATFTALDHSILEPLFTPAAAATPIRVWVPACSTGEEAYSIAILLLDLQTRTANPRPLQIFATDIDARAIEIARAGQYPASIAGTMSKERLEHHFTEERGGYKVSKTLRESCIFSVHDIFKDPPFLRLDIISCRNLLMLMQSSRQDNILKIFHYALQKSGGLLLGKSENIPAQSPLFIARDKLHRIYTPRPSTAHFPTFLLGTRQPPSHTSPNRQSPAQTTDLIDRQANQLMARYSPAFVVVNPQNEILRISGQIGKYIDPIAGTATLNLFDLIHGDLRSATRVGLIKMRRTGERQYSEGVSLRRGPHVALVNLIIDALPDPPDHGLLIVAFQDVNTPPQPDVPSVGEDAPTVNPSAVATLEKLLHETQERLRVVTAELETVSDELQSSNQEYVASNEELQSTNEELETSKYELQSLNEELQSANSELERHNEALIRINADLANFFDSTSIATLFLDKDLIIRRFTPGMLDIFKLREGDEGRPISDIVTRLVSDVLPQDVREVLRSLKPTEREVTAEGGVTYLMKVRPYRDLNQSVNGAVLSFVDISERKLHEQARSSLAAIVESSQDGIISHDLNGIITSWNAGAELLLGYMASEALGQHIATLLCGPVAGAWPDLKATIETQQPRERFDSSVMTKSGQSLDVSITISPVREGSGRIVGASVVARDISERKAADRKAELLLGELDHRVKNILAVVLAVISQTVSSGLSPEAFAQEIEGRIKAVAKAHSMLTHAGHGTLSLRDVIITELAPYDREAGRIEVQGRDVDMTPKAGMALAMAIHELTSNAAKYGALSKPEGRLSVFSALSNGPEGAMLNLEWRETNGPVVVPPTRRGFGTSLIERALAYELDAKVTRSFDPSGVVCQFVIPLTAEVGQVHPIGSA